MIGFLIAAAIITMLTVMDDTIKSEDDMQNYLGIFMLASVPDRRDYINSHSQNKKRKKAKTQSQGKKQPEQEHPR